MVILPEVLSVMTTLTARAASDAVEGRSLDGACDDVAAAFEPFAEEDGRCCDADEIDRYGEHGAQQDCDQEYLFHGCDFLRFFIVCRDE